MHFMNTLDLIERSEFMLNERCLTLHKISGLLVSTYHKKGINYFVFSDQFKTLKTMCTYPKAKLFAEGVAMGRKLGE